MIRKRITDDIFTLDLNFRHKGGVGQTKVESEVQIRWNHEFSKKVNVLNHNFREMSSYNFGWDR